MSSVSTDSCLSSASGRDDLLQELRRALRELNDEGMEAEEVALFQTQLLDLEDSRDKLRELVEEGGGERGEIDEERVGAWARELCEFGGRLLSVIREKQNEIRQRALEAQNADLRVERFQMIRRRARVPAEWGLNEAMDDFAARTLSALAPKDADAWLTLIEFVAEQPQRDSRAREWRKQTLRCLISKMPSLVVRAEEEAEEDDENLDVEDRWRRANVALRWRQHLAKIFRAEETKDEDMLEVAALEALEFADAECKTWRLKDLWDSGQYDTGDATVHELGGEGDCMFFVLAAAAKELKKKPDTVAGLRELWAERIALLRDAKDVRSTAVESLGIDSNEADEADPEVLREALRAAVAQTAEQAGESCGGGPVWGTDQTLLMFAGREPFEDVRFQVIPLELSYRGKLCTSITGPESLGRPSRVVTLLNIDGIHWQLVKINSKAVVTEDEFGRSELGRKVREICEHANPRRGYALVSDASFRRSSTRRQRRE